jgi:hypothetical protein
MELSTVLPVELEERDLQLFLEGRCGVKDYFICEGYCYSNEWLKKLAEEFKNKIIYHIFFKKDEGKAKDGKKKGKKEKVPLVTEEELQEVLFSCGFADYSAAETLAP